MDVNTLFNCDIKACSEIQNLEEIVTFAYNVGEKVEDDSMESLEVVTSNEIIIAHITFHKFWTQIEKTTLGDFMK